MAANNILATYSPESVVIIISNNTSGGAGFTHTVSGYADGDFINIVRTIPHATLYTGADASNARVVRAVKNCEVTLTLHQASESNDVFSQLLILDEESRNGRDVFQITIKDTSGRTVASSSAAFIGTSPDVGFGVELGTRDWVLQAINMSIFEGGNGKFTPPTLGTLTSLGNTPDDYWNTNT